MPMSTGCSIALKAEFAALVSHELQRVDKKQASKFTLTAAADTMRTEIEGAAAEQQRCAVLLAEAMLWQTNHQQSPYDTMWFESAAHCRAAEFVRFRGKATACRAAHRRRIEIERAVNDQRHHRVVAQAAEYATMAARSERQRLEDVFQRMDIGQRPSRQHPRVRARSSQSIRRVGIAIRHNAMQWRHDGMDVSNHF